MVKIRLFVIRCFIKYFFTENEKCMFTQSLNEQKEYLKKELRNGLITSSDFFSDIEDVDRFKSFFKNELWK